ncbi:cytochrome P450 [Williamsia maris]|uniref:Cholest-4-en-3-one 26-monooxygenase n=1 Tax=Williamsia maris TaxID=72806 RepID=A0ABT1HHJ9_9NOCA|nr:cytochrome P450 [Williamsia maris]MCP2177719.1 cholest-4-en-3-one 26-monooxygenase [Williamsia maris]
MTTELPTRCPFGAGWDLTDPALLENGMPHHEFTQMRETKRIFWIDQDPEVGPFRDNGYWVATRHEDIRAISKNSTDWSSNTQGAVMRLPDMMTPELLEYTKAMLINHDPPEHTRMRKVVSRLFTPRAVNALHDILDARAREIVSAAIAKGPGNFVDDVAVDLPLSAIADLIGVPAADREKLFTWTNAVMNTDDPDYGDIDAAEANAALLGYAYAMAEDRRKNPAEDIITTLVNADVDGEALDEAEFGFFVILIAVAGNETTRNAITHGMNAFLDHPEQWEQFKRDRPSTAADEVIRWATPVHCFQRTAINDVVLGDVTIRAGERVGMFYSSANFDDEVFENPNTFDITRSPNPHLAFGGSGAHYCVGANLARMEVDIMFNAIADLAPDITKLADPTRLRSGWINGVKDLEVSYGR